MANREYKRKNEKKKKNIDNLENKTIKKTTL